MFNWFKNLFSKKSITAKDPYKLEERQIFSYFNGERQVYADPIAIWKRIMDVGPSLSIDIKVSLSPMKDANKAYLSTVKTIRDIFMLKPLMNEIEITDAKTLGTLTNDECCDLLNDFMTWQDEIKKNSKKQVTSVMEVLPPSQSSSVENPIMQSTQVSGSTEDANNIVKAEPSQKVYLSDLDPFPPPLTTSKQ